MKIPLQWTVRDLRWLSSILGLALAACATAESEPKQTRNEVVAPSAFVGSTEGIPCRTYGSAPEARRVAELWLAGRKSRYDEQIAGVSWVNFLWSIGFPVMSERGDEYATVSLLPDGHLVRCETIRECAVAPEAGEQECPPSQEPIPTRLQAMEMGVHFLESQGVRVDSNKPPIVYSQPAWLVFVQEEPLMPGGHYFLLISPEGEVIEVILGE